MKNHFLTRTVATNAHFIFTKRILLLLVAVTISGVLSAQTFSVAGINYAITGPNTVELGNNQNYFNSNAAPSTLTIPSTVSYKDSTYTVTRVGAKAFYGAVGGSACKLKLPHTIISIGDSAFSSQTAFQPINLPVGVKIIGDYVFANKWGGNAVLPNGVTHIGRGVFLNCYALGKVYIPASVKSIGDSAFYAEYSAETVKVESGTPLQIGSDIFPPKGYYSTYGTTLYVPNGSKKLYEKAEGWKKFGKIIEYDVQPQVSTQAPESVTDTTAYLEAIISGANTAKITQQGFVFAETSKNANPQLGGQQVTTLNGDNQGGVMYGNLDSLKSNTQYSYNAFVKTKNGVAYGKVSTFTTSPVVVHTFYVKVINKTGVNFPSFQPIDTAGQVVYCKPINAQTQEQTVFKYIGGYDGIRGTATWGEYGNISLAVNYLFNRLGGHIKNNAAIPGYIKMNGTFKYETDLDINPYNGSAIFTVTIKNAGY